ncbi:MAG: biotin transporter BioY [Nannocystaceae bacterium]|nr:biotin transporter BioY [Nannocystaceae bacterium]
MAPRTRNVKTFVNRVARGVFTATLGALVIALSARATFSLPGSELPQSAQTLAVLVMGATLGCGRGTLAVALYLFAGAVGLPVFSDGTGGLAKLLGPSAGYLLGFLCAAAAVGWLADRRPFGQAWWRDSGLMLAAHGLILLLGGGMLAMRLGPLDAWSQGVTPFLVGAVLKSAAAALLMRAAGGRLPLSRRGSVQAES